MDERHSLATHTKERRKEIGINIFCCDHWFIPPLLSVVEMEDITYSEGQICVDDFNLAHLLSFAVNRAKGKKRGPRQEQMITYQRGVCASPRSKITVILSAGWVKQVPAPYLSGCTLGGLLHVCNRSSMPLQVSPSVRRLCVLSLLDRIKSTSNLVRRL